MSTSLIIAIALVAIAVFGGLVFVTASRKTGVRGAGALSRETKKRDKTATVSVPTGRAFEAAATASSTELAVPAQVEIEQWVAPDAEVLGETRRSFFNRATVIMLSTSLGAFGA